MDERERFGRGLLISALVVGGLVVLSVVLSIVFALLGWWEVIFR
jgi:hypothetical protein